MKKTVSLAILAMLVCGLTACGNQEKVKEDDGKYHVGLCQWVEHAALDEATMGFQDALTDKLGDEVVFDVQVAQGNTQDCQEILNGFVSDNMDLIMANATSALISASQATNTIPIVATSITDYGTALNMREWTGASGINVTGTSDLAPIESQADMIQELVPEAEKVGILYCSAETNSIYQAQKMGSILTEKGISFENYTIANKEELEKTAQKAALKCDVLYIPTDNTIASQADILKEILISEKVPMIAGEEGLCEAGIATLSISYYDIGYTAGEMAYEILAEGKEPGEIDVRYAETVTKKYNPENCEALGIAVPDDYEALE
ncbi:MAG: ABC transporter substrate-binding protein [Lachnospiraceae bacterium]|nr:ABC transporter substrate-binding protein [Lachnospiraceae bacterium]